MRRIICLLLALFLPCTALAQELTLLSEYPVQSSEAIEYLHDAHLLPDGNLLLRYYTLDHSESTRSAGKEGQVFNHYMGVFTPEGVKVWESLSAPYELAKDQNGDTLIIKPDSFVREYYPSGTALEYCWTEYDFSGNVWNAELDMQTREEEIFIRNLPHYSLEVGTEMPMRLEALSLTTGAESELPVGEQGVVHFAEVDGQLAVLNRGEEGPAIIRFYDESLREVRTLTTPFDYGESVEMCVWDGKLYCFAMYAGDWESYYVYTCDLATGAWSDDPVYMQVPEERCYLWDVIPVDGGFLLLIDEGDLPDDPFPYSGNFNPVNLYAMAEDGTLSLCLDLHGDALLLPQTASDRFTLLMRTGADGGYVLRTYAPLQELPTP